MISWNKSGTSLPLGIENYMMRVYINVTDGRLTRAQLYSVEHRAVKTMYTRKPS